MPAPVESAGIALGSASFGGDKSSAFPFLVAALAALGEQVGAV